MYTLAPFAQNVDSIRICPDDPFYDQRLADPNKESSYVINEYVSSGNVANAVLYLSKIKDASKLIVLFEGSDQRGPTDDHAHCSTWYSAFKITNGFVWSGIISEIKPDRHNASANYLIADGSVENIGESTLYQWVQRDVVQGTNFAQPQQ
jgi:prepilin-type processing-associated H-X9-DG protein